MIVTVTLNPAIDKTVEVEDFGIGKLNKEKKIIMDPGGKGINVSKVAYSLGCDTVATGFLGGTSGNFIKMALDDLSINHEFIKIEETTRTNMKIYDSVSQDTTELNERGPLIKEHEYQALKQWMNLNLNENDIVVLSGSGPAGVPDTVYEELTTIAQGMGAKVILDASGDKFVYGLKAKPYLIKPNIHELEEMFGRSLSDEYELIKKCESIIKGGVEKIVVSLGSEGALYMDGKVTLKCHPLKVDAHSTVGAGDALVGALACAIEQNFETEDMLKLAIATSAGAVTTEGTKPVEKAWIDSHIGLVKIERLK